MKQVVQNYNTGELSLADVPAPICRAGGVLVRSAFSLVSAGTERMKVSQARMGLIAKAKARPDKVRQVVQSVQQVGLMETYQKVCERLDALTPLGYSLAGVVEEVGAGVDEFQVGDRVACAGEGIACHAEFVSVPRNLCAKLPEGVDFKDAAFATVGAIAMHGVRQARVTLGDNVLVIGLGLVGLLAVQILKAAGCRVIGVDVDSRKVELARLCGADRALTRDAPGLSETIAEATGGLGPDVVYIAASTASTDPMEFAGDVVRDRGKVVIVGMIKVEANWQIYYDKEVSVILSRSYGPGRYDANYEQKGIDYPVGYVRWTLRRNLEEFLRLISTGHMIPSRLSPKVFPFERAADAYQQLREGGGEEAAGILFQYPPDATPARRVTVGRVSQNGRAISGRVGIGMIGAGNFATGTLIPALKRIPSARLRAICSARGLTARSAAGRHGFEYCASDFAELLDDPEIHAVVIATRHDTHARFAAEALRAGKHVFVEKPLALTHEQLDDVIAAQAESGLILMPGFNRRFSPLSIAVRDFFANRAGPIEVICRVNAGALKGGSWYKDDEEGGWRIVSEGCHFVDLISFICGCPPVRVQAEMIGGSVAGAQHDNCTAILRMQDGSLGTLIYVANGDSGYEKERVEVFGEGRTAVIENWHSARLFHGGKKRQVPASGSGKGHGAELAHFVAAVTGSAPVVLRLEDSAATTRCTLAIVESMTTAGETIPLGDAESCSPRREHDV